MAHSSFARSLCEVSNTDGSLCKAILDQSRNSTNSSSSSVTTSVLLSKMRANHKTPSNTPSRRPLTPSRKDVDRVTPGRSAKTPNTADKRNMLEGEGDRFIPNRQATDITRAQYVIKHGQENLCAEDEEYQKAISDSLFSGECNSDRKILRFKSDVRSVVPMVPMQPKTSPQRKGVVHRLIPNMPEKVLDAPEILDDFYLNILDWSSNSLVAVALNQDVYLWHAHSGQIACLMSAGFESEYISSVKWSPDMPHAIAIGLSTGRVQLWDAERQTLLRTMRLGESSAVGRVPTVTWRDHILTSGCRAGVVRHHDTRIAEHVVGVNAFHNQEICGLVWSPDRRILASGANDNQMALWSTSAAFQMNGVVPELTLSEHQAAVKAMAWCPWKNNLLCSGGGTSDHSLKFWNTTTGSCIKSVDVSAQVSGIIWNTEYREVLTSHGTPKNRLCIWRYPDISLVTELSEHQNRVLSIASSPDNQMVASCASDETVRIWHCFEVDQAKKKSQEKPLHASSHFTRTLR